ncbi:MAG TPA: peptide deformylase [Verrucomicrobiota bacterium]|jgi:peptide deformylase|nr:MAG: Peptide deformylase [Verrucomicrobia bacterium ADurb.Bin118]HPY29523.1 peptide deformylase [Verrucomicrobiota bacterium]HQB15649.1 peptide deformylase [Verrucomicrobiota bacterium]
MILEVVKYGHPVLRQKGARIEAVTPAIRTLAQDMLATMYAAHGIGLAAQQVGQALQLTVLDIRGITDRPSQLTLDRQASDPEAFMPLVLINPEITPLAPLVSGPEGCLSFPELFGDVPRPESARVQAWDADGQPLDFQCGGLLARAIQHEHDHLHGILFIDRMDKATREALRPDLERLQAETKAALRAAQK